MEQHLIETAKISERKTAFRGRRTYLVQGVGRRAINVVVLPFFVKHRYLDDLELAKVGAEHAVKRGWKTVYVHPDECYGEYAEASNPSMFNAVMLGNRSGGDHLISVGEMDLF